MVSALVGPVVASAGLVALMGARRSAGAHRRALGRDRRVRPVPPFHRDRRDGRTRLPAPLTLVAVGAFMHRSARGSAAALAGGLAVLLAGVTFGSALAQRGSGSASSASPGGGGSAQLSWVHFSWGPLFSGGVDPTRRCTPVRESPCRRKPHASRSVPRPGSPGRSDRPGEPRVLIVSVLGLLAVVWVALSGLPWVLVIVPL